MTIPVFSFSIDRHKMSISNIIDRIHLLNDAFAHERNNAVSVDILLTF